MKKILIILFVFMSVFIVPAFASPTGGGDSVAEFSIPGILDADFSIMESQVEFPNMEFNFIFIETIVSIGRSKMHILSKMSSIKTNIQLKAVEELMLKKTTINEMSGNLIRYVRLAS